MSLGKSWSKTYGGFEKPRAQMFVDGTEIPFTGGKKGIKVLKIHVEKTVGCEASTCIVRIKAERSEADPYTPSFLNTLKAGAGLRIDLGYGKKMKTVFVGYISSIELDVAGYDNTIVHVKGMDGKVWMMSNRKSELIKGASTYTAAVKSIFNNYAAKFMGNSVKISSEPKLKVPIYQLNESDYDFVCRMAFLSGALFFIDNGKFKFIDMYSEKTAKTSIEKSNISGIHMSVDLWGIPKQVETISQDKKHFKNTVKGMVAKSDEVGKGSAASNVSKNVNSKVVLVDNTLYSANEASFASKVEQNRRNFNFVNVRVDLKHFVPDLKLGSTYKIEDIGSMVDNSFMLCGVEYDISGSGICDSSIILRSPVLDKPKRMG